MRKGKEHIKHSLLFDEEIKLLSISHCCKKHTLWYRYCVTFLVTYVCLTAHMEKVIVMKYNM